MPEIKSLEGRCMFIWKLKPVLSAEMGIRNFVRKAKRAKLSGVWIKVAESGTQYANVRGEMESWFHEVVQRLVDRESMAGDGMCLRRPASMLQRRKRSLSLRWRNSSMSAVCSWTLRLWKDFSRETLKRRIPIPGCYRAP